MLWSVYAAIGFAVALGAITSTVAHAVASRRLEAHIRLALGAQPWTLTASMMAQEVRLTAVGVTVGAVGSVALVRLMRATITDIESADALRLVTIGVIFTAATIIAASIPALKTVQFDARTLLRDDQ